MLRVDTRPRKRNAPRPAWKVAKSFHQWLRGRPCAADGYGLCEGVMQAAHVDHGGDKGMSTKASDRFAIPLCAGHHARQHNRGWQTFESECLGGKPATALADAYWHAWPGRAEWERENARG